jgi:hypothetical protein
MKGNKSKIMFSLFLLIVRSNNGKIIPMLIPSKNVDIITIKLKYMDLKLL